MKRTTNPRPVVLSKRANVFYLEHAKVIQQEDRVIYLTQDGGEFEQMFNIPERNTAFLLLGKGTSITDAAMRRLAAANVIVGFCGSGGSPLFGVNDLAFMTPQSEYRPTEYMQAWSEMWFDQIRQIQTARLFLNARVEMATNKWQANPYLRDLGIVIPENCRSRFLADIENAENLQEMLLAEARWAKCLYADLAQGHKLDFVRSQGGKTKRSAVADKCNGFLDHGNYIAYGYAAVVLCGLGISFAMPVLHGKTRRGALVFDVADLIKDAYVMPLAFEYATSRRSQQDFRNALIEQCQREEVLDWLFDFIKSLCKK